jgi:hypothetical protein
LKDASKKLFRVGSLLDVAKEGLSHLRSEPLDDGGRHDRVRGGSLGRNSAGGRVQEVIEYVTLLVLERPRFREASLEWVSLLRTKTMGMQAYVLHGVTFSANMTARATRPSRLVGSIMASVPRLE